MLKKRLKQFWILLKKTYKSWDSNDPFGRSAIIAYYTLFSLPSLLLIVVTIAGYFFGQDAVQGRITKQFSSFIGAGSAEAIEQMISNAALNDSSTFSVIFGAATLIFGATGAFFQLKRAMNNIWKVRAKHDTFWDTVKDRAISFGMILVIGMMLLVSLMISAIIGVVSEYIESFYPFVAAIAVDLLNFVLSFAFITFLFAAMFKLLPDIHIRWKVTIIGAVFTALLFLIGEYAIGFYFGEANPASIYEGASTVVLILLWVYYTGVILFFGAELTRQYAIHFDEMVVPNKYADHLPKAEQY